MIQDSKAPGGSLTSQGMWFLYLLLCKCPTSAWEFRRFVGFLWWWYKVKPRRINIQSTCFETTFLKTMVLHCNAVPTVGLQEKTLEGAMVASIRPQFRTPSNHVGSFLTWWLLENHWNFGLLRMNSHLASNRLNIQIVIMTCFTAAWPFSHRGSLNSTILHMALRLVGCTLWWTVASLTRFYEKYTAIALFSEVQTHNSLWCWVHNMLS